MELDEFELPEPDNSTPGDQQTAPPAEWQVPVPGAVVDRVLDGLADVTYDDEQGQAGPPADEDVPASQVADQTQVHVQGATPVAVTALQVSHCITSAA